MLTQKTIHSFYKVFSLLKITNLPLNFYKKFLTDTNPNLVFVQQESVERNFIFLKKSTMTSFFITTMVDVPVSLKKSKSLYRAVFELQTLKFLNFIMRGGNRGLVIKNFTSALIQFSQNTTYLKHLGVEFVT